jgi:hypothetical protein
MAEGLIPCPICSKRYEWFQPHGWVPCPVCGRVSDDIPHNPAMGWQPEGKLASHEEALEAAIEALEKALNS